MADTGNRFIITGGPLGQLLRQNQYLNLIQGGLVGGAEGFKWWCCTRPL